MDNIVLYSIFILICLVLSAFFAMAEMAFSSVNTIRLQSLSDGNGKKAKKAKKALQVTQNFDKALTMILITNNVVNFACSTFATLLCIDLFGDIGAAIATGATTFIVLAFCEITPKCIGKENSEAISLNSASVINFFTFILTPIIYFFIGVKTLALKMTKTENSPSVTEEELKYIIENMEEQGVLEEDESDMVQSAFEFDEKTVMSVLTPRVDLIALDIDDDPKKHLEVIFTSRYSRIPVFKNSADNIIGILHARDYLEKIIENNFSKDNANVNLESLLKKPHFIYKTKKLNSIMNEFKKKQINMAIVTDEYGGTIGIVTMEDLLEKIVGDIWDEDEKIETMYEKVKSGGYIVNGDMPLDELFELFGKEYKNKNEDTVTVGGFIHNHLDKIPVNGEYFIFDDLKFVVKKSKERRIVTAFVKNHDV